MPRINGRNVNISRGGSPIEAIPGEFTVQCQRCLSLETIFVTKGKMEPSRKYDLVKGKVFHRCGCPLARPPCLVYRGSA